MAPLLSVVVAFYGVEAYLADCLESIQAQLFTDFEVILVDDGSPDRSAEIAQRFVDEDARFRLVRQANAGPGPARNVGVGHAVGAYLMFVDGDDLLGPRAFALLVGSLERTGSDIAAGNAWRFNRSRGTYPSWTHVSPFREDQERTHVTVFPELIRDRMLWNKVYRRSFWDREGFAFPPIRYEDYPVALKAHLRASAVDLISQRIYLWRDREAGTSITQQVFTLDNARDRVTSAHMVLDLLEDGVPPDVVEAVHAYLIDVDLVALAGAIAATPESHRGELETLARGLALRLNEQEPPRVTRLASLLHEAFVRGDVQLVESMARWRATGDKKALMRDVFRRVSPMQVLRIRAAITRGRRSQLSPRPRRLVAELLQAEVSGGTVELRVHAKIRRQFAERATVTTTLQGRGVGTTSARVDVGGLLVTVRLSADDFASAADRPDGLVLNVRSGVVLRWRGKISAPRPHDLPPPVPLGHGRWGVVARLWDDSTSLVVDVLEDPVVTMIDTDADGARLRFPHLETGTLVVQRPAPTPDFRTVIAGHVADVRWEDLMAFDPPDDPVTGIGHRAIYVADAVRAVDHERLNEVKKERAQEGLPALDEYASGRVYPLEATRSVDVDGPISVGFLTAKRGWLEFVHDHHNDGLFASEDRELDETEADAEMHAELDA